MELEQLQMELRDSRCRLEDIIKTIPKSKRKPIYKRIQRLGSWIDTITFITTLKYNDKRSKKKK